MSWYSRWCFNLCYKLDLCYTNSLCFFNGMAILVIKNKGGIDICYIWLQTCWACYHEGIWGLVSFWNQPQVVVSGVAVSGTSVAFSWLFSAWKFAETHLQLHKKLLKLLLCDSFALKFCHLLKTVRFFLVLYLMWGLCVQASPVLLNHNLQLDGWASAYDKVHIYAKTNASETASLEIL